MRATRKQAPLGGALSNLVPRRGLKLPLPCDNQHLKLMMHLSAPKQSFVINGLVTAFGRKLTVDSSDLELLERPLLGKADIAQ